MGSDRRAALKADLPHASEQQVAEIATGSHRALVHYMGYVFKRVLWLGCTLCSAWMRKGKHN